MLSHQQNERLRAFAKLYGEQRMCCVSIQAETCNPTSPLVHSALRHMRATTANVRFTATRPYS